VNKTAVVSLDQNQNRMHARQKHLLLNQSILVSRRNTGSVKRRLTVLIAHSGDMVVGILLLFNGFNKVKTQVGLSDDYKVDPKSPWQLLKKGVTLVSYSQGSGVNPLLRFL